MKKKFDSVKMMRQIRENLSKDLSNLCIREKINLLKKEFPKIKRRKATLTTGVRREKLSGLSGQN